MTTMNEEMSNLESQIRYLERENRLLRETLLDHFAQTALASGRCSPEECYTWAKMAMKERGRHVGT